LYYATPFFSSVFASQLIVIFEKKQTFVRVVVSTSKTSDVALVLESFLCLVVQVTGSDLMTVLEASSDDECCFYENHRRTHRQVW